MVVSCSLMSLVDTAFRVSFEEENGISASSLTCILQVFLAVASMSHPQSQAQRIASSEMASLTSHSLYWSMALCSPAMSWQLALIEPSSKEWLTVK